MLRRELRNEHGVRLFSFSFLGMGRIQRDMSLRADSPAVSSNVRARLSNCHGSRIGKSAGSISSCSATATFPIGRSRTFLNSCAESTRKEVRSDSNHILHRSSHELLHAVGGLLDRDLTVTAQRDRLRGPDAC